MTEDEIIEMAQECKLIGMRPHLDGIYSEALVAFAKLVAAKEREMNITDEQFETLIGLLAVVETSGSVNGKPVLGLAGAEEAFFTIQEFVSKLEEQT